ncbi:PucR family transcriptional regulator [Amycolatopsis anabasis]|uniref:PucR family transcriptional regulator n=1 Tax=Amycolatopsis anabasis TaxID=1840409 RepID=UPI001FE3CFE8|nr:helix-turn-helix domain-containing protein [Amycolatopsis anabasis]
MSELIRDLAEQLLPVRDDVIDKLWAASLSGARQHEYVDDPVLAQADRRLNASGLTQWLMSNFQSPGRRVPPAKDTEMLIYARDLVLRGLDADELEGWRASQRAAWEIWLDACFAATSDPAELRELVEISATSLTQYVDDSIAAVLTYADEVRAELASGMQAERHSTVQLLIEGAPLDRARAEAQLGYALTGPHVAAIAWTDANDDAHHLERAAEYVMRVAGATRRLTLVASTAALWLWLPVPEVPAVAPILDVLKGLPGVRVALGRPQADVTGFRSSHLDAAAAQRLLARVRSPRRVVRYEDVHLLDLLTTDTAQADRFVSATLGELAAADASLRHALRTYVDEGFNVSNTADRLFAHRNTIDRRLVRAKALLPRPLSDDAASVATALRLVELREDHPAVE